MTDLRPARGRAIELDRFQRTAGEIGLSSLVKMRDIMSQDIVVLNAVHAYAARECSNPERHGFCGLAADGRIQA